MEGTSKEILLWLTRHSEYAEYMAMSRQRLVGLRKHVNANELNEGHMEEILTRLSERLEKLRISRDFILPSVPSVTCKRRSYMLPAVVRDHHGKYFQEQTMIQMFRREKMMSDLNLDKVCAAIKRGDMPRIEVVREVMRRKGWSMVADRYVMPSVWEVE